MAEIPKAMQPRKLTAAICQSRSRSRRQTNRPHTSTYALTNVTLPYAVELANRGWRSALQSDRALALGLNTHDGQVTYAPVAEAHGLASAPLAEVLG